MNKQLKVSFEKMADELAKTWRWKSNKKHENNSISVKNLFLIKRQTPLSEVAVPHFGKRIF